MQSEFSIRLLNNRELSSDSPSKHLLAMVQPSAELQAEQNFDLFEVWSFGCLKVRGSIVCVVVKHSNFEKFKLSSVLKFDQSLKLSNFQVLMNVFGSAFRLLVCLSTLHTRSLLQCFCNGACL